MISLGLWSYNVSFDGDIVVGVHRVDLKIKKKGGERGTVKVLSKQRRKEYNLQFSTSSAVTVLLGLFTTNGWSRNTDIFKGIYKSN